MLSDLMSFIKLEDHPAWHIIQSFKPLDTTQAWKSLLVFLDLSEGKTWWNMKIHYNEVVGKVFLSGHESREKIREIILPLSTDANVCPSVLKEYHEQITLPDFKPDGLILAISNSDASTVYYRVNQGLIPPEAPDVVSWKKYRREMLPDLQRQHVSGQSAKYIKDRVNR